MQGMRGVAVSESVEWLSKVTSATTVSNKMFELGLQHLPLCDAQLCLSLQAKRKLPDDIPLLDKMFLTRKQLYQKYVKSRQR